MKYENINIRNVSESPSTAIFYFSNAFYHNERARIKKIKKRSIYTSAGKFLLFSSFYFDQLATFNY